MTFRTVLAVVLAGVAGIIAYALSAALIVDAAQLQLAANPKFHLVGIVFAVPLPIVYRFVPGAPGAALALLLLALLPALATKAESEANLAWPALLSLTFIYALAAMVVYRLVLGPR